MARTAIHTHRPNGQKKQAFRIKSVERESWLHEHEENANYQYVWVTHEVMATVFVDLNEMIKLMKTLGYEWDDYLIDFVTKTGESYR